jgi:hypothetical protein
MFFHLDLPSLHILSCLWIFAYVIQQCLTDMPSVFEPLFAGLGQPSWLSTIDRLAECFASPQKRENLREKVACRVYLPRWSS